ncbi:ComEC/Rec2 family competence protein [Paenibacillus lentus]|uniref:MBL fold metallo-hydrolase n=1 Tax=Paenibacillus lentus TaxID=1338368 RepID=A0A3Q8SAL8_9BACL|nr:MBL fold metallo-hydrolase [Paenibacillus lentus]AZK46306.1 MBL fold metallo-hydrolase [Paenibacillus lentus]
MTYVIDFLNVGFGEAAVVRIEDGQRSYCLVVDAGDADCHKHARRCSLEQYVREYGINKIDALILTHFHKDHIGGVREVLGHVPIGEILLHVPLPSHLLNSRLSDHSTPILASLSLYIAILKQAKELGIPVRQISEPFALSELAVEFRLLTPNQAKLQQLQAELESLEVEALNRQQERLTRIDRMLNDTALAVLIRYKHNPAALLTSDVGLDFWSPYESEIKDVYLLQAPHHGDAQRISQALLHTVSPKVVVVSADDEGTYQLPHPEFEVAVTEHSAARIYYTEEAGSRHRIIRMDLNERTIHLIK